MGLSMMIAAPITAVGAIIMAVNTNARLSLLLLVVVPFMALIIVLLLLRIVPLFRLNQIKIDNWCSDQTYNRYLVEYLRHEDPMDAIARSVETTIQKAEEEGIQGCDYLNF